jgi:hypothetical protein
MIHQFISGLATVRKSRRPTTELCFAAFSNRKTPRIKSGPSVARERYSRDFAVVMAQTSSDRDVFSILSTYSIK